MLFPPEKVMREDIEEIRQELKTYKPGERSNAPENVNFPNRMNIGLFGRTGCGKTSLINSLLVAVKGGRITPGKLRQVASHEISGGHTLRLQEVILVKDKLYVIDNRGLDSFLPKETKREMEAQLDGMREPITEVQWKEHLIEGEQILVNGFPISCVVLVFSALDDNDKSIVGLFAVMKLLLDKTGQYPLAVITNIDRGKEENVNKIKTTLRVMGITQIFQVANITTSRELLEVQHEYHMLRLIDRCISDCDEAFVFKDRVKKKQKQKELDDQRKRDQEADRVKKEQEQKEFDDQRRRDQEAAEKAKAGAGMAIGAVIGAAVVALGAAFLDSI